jgi:hypothetical protein
VPVHPVPVAHLVLEAHRALGVHRVLAAHRALGVHLVREAHHVPAAVLGLLRHVPAVLTQAHRAMVNAAQVLRNMANVRRARVLVVRVAMAMPLVGVQVPVAMAMPRVTANPTASAVNASLTVNVASASHTASVRRVRVQPARAARVMLRVGVQVLEPVVRVAMAMPRVTANPTASAVSESLTAIVLPVRVLVVRAVMVMLRVGVQVREPVVRAATLMLRVGVQVRGAMIAAVRFEKRSLNVL